MAIETAADNYEIVSIIEQISKKEIHASGEELNRKLLFVILSWMFHTREEYENVFQSIEELYANFDYPARMDPFIYYMPTKDPNDDLPQNGTERMTQHWMEYFLDEYNYFNFSPTKSVFLSFLSCSH